MPAYDDDFDDDDRGFEPPDDDELLEEIKDLLRDKVHLNLADHVSKETVLRDLCTALHAHPGIDLVGDDEGVGGEDKDDAYNEDEDEDAYNEDDEEYDPEEDDLGDPATRKRLIESGSAREELPVAMMSHARRRKVGKEVVRNAFRQAVSKHGHGRLSHPRKSDGGMTAKRGAQAAREIVGNCPWLR
jgi:hypothetical protein